MYVGQLKNLCEFDNPSTEMRDDAVLDYELRDKGLTKMDAYRLISIAGNVAVTQIVDRTLARNEQEIAGTYHA